jgi:phosphodiesterase/alkaline phosphatase D-like protein
VNARRAAAALLVLGVLAAGCGPDDQERAAAQHPATSATRTTPPATASTATAAADRSAPVRSGFVAFGDFGGGPAQRAVASAMYRWAAGRRVDALVTTGDNVYERGEPQRFGAQLDRP